MPSRLPRSTSTATLRRFGRSRGGATAVEFGMIAMPFFGLLFSIIETALTFWSNQVLETAVANASRQIYTGQFQAANPTKTTTADQLKTRFKEAVCSNVTALFNCASMVTIDVRPVGTYGEAQVSPPIKDGKYDTAGYGYQEPGGNQITVVRATMEYPVFTNFLAASSGLSNGNRLIIASSVFRTEPFSQ